MLIATAHRATTDNVHTSFATPSADLADIAAQRLRNSRHRAFQQVACSCEDGVLILRGVVASYHLKQLAQTIVRALDNVSRVENSIRVRSSATE